eukprot:1526228-Alexandrium_andersonii.AAC.1
MSLPARKRSGRQPSVRSRLPSHRSRGRAATGRAATGSWSLGRRHRVRGPTTTRTSCLRLCQRLRAIGRLTTSRRSATLRPASASITTSRPRSASAWGTRSAAGARRS